MRTASGPERRYVFGKTKTEALAALRKATADRDRGLVFNAGSLTLGGYLDRWLRDSQGYGKANHVRELRTAGTCPHHSQVELHQAGLNWLSYIKLSLITPTDVRTLYREKVESGLSASSVQRVHALLHKALKQAVNDGLIPRNGTESVKVPRQPRREMRTFTHEQARAFLEAAKDDRLGALYVVAIHTGLRQANSWGCAGKTSTSKPG